MICKRCHGSGNLLRPTKAQRIRFIECTTCCGLGVRTNPQRLAEAKSRHLEERAKNVAA